ncbi:TetR/AcrR family transcriptional regulator [Amycolatopsis acidicola]|uniref:TetR/AcrR family transcriptional regulator n=1 Tax=Amycolatopsis acidicola TaxID=2596893 RepID=A0A5N0V4G5_9PSEU|nr:TetR/AcrR family transcriptional regulator [Amycolatopsis acidicola]KAA9158883.1 TetR/AcrR family transcriptional regulator [Amycolatopsis acidicola]
MTKRGPMDCLTCGRALREAGRGRPPRYCSRACRSKAYRARLADRTEPPAWDETLTAQRIVRAAIELADEGGAAALSMRALAARLGSGAMSLYRYVANRDDLVDLMADAVFAERPLPEDGAPEGWRAKLELSARAEWAVYQAHPWLPQLGLITRPPIGPNLMAYTDWRMQAVAAEHDVPFATLVQVATLVTSFVQSAALSENRERQETGLSRREWMRSRQRVIDRSLRARPLPMIARFGEEAFQATQPQAVFEFGLERILDGIGLLLVQPT